MDEKCDHDKRFRGVLFTTNGCLACELEKMISENERLGEKLKELEEENLELKEEIEKHIKPGSYMSSYGTVYPSHHMALAKLVKKV